MVKYFLNITVNTKINYYICKYIKYLLLKKSKIMQKVFNLSHIFIWQASSGTRILHITYKLHLSPLLFLLFRNPLRNQIKKNSTTNYCTIFCLIFNFIDGELNLNVGTFLLYTSKKLYTNIRKNIIQLISFFAWNLKYVLIVLCIALSSYCYCLYTIRCESSFFFRF